MGNIYLHNLNNEKKALKYYLEAERIYNDHIKNIQIQITDNHLRQKNIIAFSICFNDIAISYFNLNDWKKWEE